MKTPLLIFILCSLAYFTNAQFQVDGQVVQRAEYRHGFGRLLLDGEDPAAFIGQRTRLQAKYQLDKLTFFMSVQDIRTWGSTPQIKASDPFLSVHEAWAELQLSEKWSARLGRQELNYDNFRFLGNLDWALQARAHDFALVKYEHEGKKLHFGAGYNQETQTLAGNAFALGNQYKTAQLIRFENKTEKVEYALLLWNDGRQRIVRDAQGQITEQDLFFRLTLGLPTFHYQLGKTKLSAFFYQQLGKDASGTKMQAFNASLQANFLLMESEAGRKFNLVAGFETLSGTPSDETSTNKSFSPQYGTNHAHNGYMDFFFVGGRLENSVGLNDFYIKGRYTFSPTLFVQADAHYFTSFADAIAADGQKLDKGLGTEIDLSLGYVFTPSISLQVGYSQAFASSSFETLTGVTQPNSLQNWAYTMLILRPTSKKKFIGILL